MMSYPSVHALARCVALVLLAVPSLAVAQSGSSLDSGRTHASRTQLEALVAQFDDAAGSAAYSGELRSRARREADLVRARLTEGDFRIGDRVALTVQGEPMFSDTFSVANGPSLVLPLIGEIPLSGVLRSELESHLQTVIGRSVRNPEVRAHSLLRISVTGEVGRPGFYVLPAETPVTEVLMAVGGTGRDANLRALRVERAGERIWEGAAMEDAVIEGRTLDQMSIRAGDQIVVPRVRRTNPWQIVQGASVALTLVLALTQLF